MSKRDMRAKKLLLAVLLAMSMQSYHAAPTWAAEIGQPAGQTETVDGKGQSGSTTTPAEEEETSAPATGEEAAAAEGEDGANTDAAMPLVPYGVRAASAGNDDYGIMPLVNYSDGTVTFSEGALDNVTSINGVYFSAAADQSHLLIGSDKRTLTNNNNTGIGILSVANGNSTVAVGYEARASANYSIAIGAYSRAYADDSIVIGENSEITDTGLGSMALGRNTKVVSQNSIAIGKGAHISGESQLYSVAIGVDSTTSKAKQVSFGHKKDDLDRDGSSFGDDLFRSVVNVADIEMHGGITGLTSIEGVAVSGSAADGLTIGGITFNNGGIMGEVTMDQAKEVSYTMKINGLDLYTGVSEWDKGSMALGKDAQISAYTGATSFNATAIGTRAIADGDNAIAIGAYSTAYTEDDQPEGNAIAIGTNARAITANSIAFGYQTYANRNAGKSVALGAYSSVDASDTVSFGHKNGDKYYDNINNDEKNYTDNLFRSLVNVKDIELNTADDGTGGAITGLTSINGVAVSVSTAAGLTVSGVTLNGGKVNEVALGLKGGTGSDKDNVFVGTVDVTQMQADVAGKADTATVSTLSNKVGTAESDIGNLKKNTAGISVADGRTVIAKGFKVGATTYGMDSSGTLTAATVNGAVITSDSFNGISIKSDGTVDGVDVSALKATVDGIKTDGVSTADTAGIKRDTTGISTTKIEDNTSITTDGLTTNKVTVGNAILENSKLTVGAVTLTGGKLSGLTAGDITSAASTEAVTGGQVYTIKSDLETSISGKADTAIVTALETATTGMSYASGTTTFTGVVTAGEFKVGVTGFGFGSDGALTAKTVNGVTISGSDAAKDAAIGGYSLKTITDDIADLKTNGGATSANTVGIKHSGTVDTVDSLTTIEGSTAISGRGIVVTGIVDATTLKEGGTELAAKYAGISEAYTAEKAALKADKADVDTLKTTVGDADTGLAAVNTRVTDLQTVTTGMSYDNDTTSTSFSGNVVVGNVGNQTHTQITDNAIIFGEGTDKQVTVDASGIHVGKKAAGGIALYADADGTHIDHTSLVTGSVTADNLNGVAISGNATDGLSVGGVNIKDLQDRVTTIENSGPGSGTSTDTEGIKRTKDNGKDVTTLEGVTSFTADGMQTANMTAATAAIGGVDFAANGVMTSVGSINGISFADGKIGGVSLSGGKVNGAEINGANFNGVDVKALKNKVDSLGTGGGTGGGTGSGDGNTSGIGKPDGDTTTIEGNTSITTDGIDTNKVNASDSIVVADGEKNKTVISKDGILVAEGEKNQVKINEDGIHVGKNSSVVNDTDGFITDKGLYIGVSSSSDTSTAKFSVAPNGNLSSKAGDYGFSNTSADGAKFTHSGDTVYGTGSQLDTTIQGNKVTTGRIDTDELYVDGNKVTVAGGTISQTDAVNNHLSGADADGNTVTNDFKTSAVNGTTQAAEKTSADGKESTKTVNNTSAGGTGVTTSKTTTDSKDNVTVKESSFGTNEKGMTLSTSNKVTDKDGKVTKDTSGTTTMTGDSISVSKTTTTTEKDADGNEKEVTKTSGTTIGSGEVTLKREDGSTIEVGSAIEGMQSDMRELDGRVNRMGVEIKEVGALSAALAGLHPQPENANSRADFAMAVGSYEGKQALAVGGFYRPDKRTMLSIGASTTSSKHMMNMGISIALDRLPEAERRAKEAAKAAGVEQETLNRVLERLAALEQDNRCLQADNEKRDVAYEKLAADYTQLKEKYIEETADRQQPEQAEAEE